MTDTLAALKAEWERQGQHIYDTAGPGPFEFVGKLVAVAEGLERERNFQYARGDSADQTIRELVVEVDALRAKYDELLHAVEAEQPEVDALRAANGRLRELLHDHYPYMRAQAFGKAERCGHETTSLGYYYCPECWEREAGAALAQAAGYEPPAAPREPSLQPVEAAHRIIAACPHIYTPEGDFDSYVCRDCVAAGITAYLRATAERGTTP